MSSSIEQTFSIEAEAKVKEYYAGVREQSRFRPDTESHNEWSTRLLRLGLNGDEYDQALATVRAMRPYWTPQALLQTNSAEDYAASLTTVMMSGLREVRDDIAGMIQWSKSNPRHSLKAKALDEAQVQLKAVRAEIRSRSQVERYLADMQ